MSLRRIMQGQRHDLLSAQGILEMDWTALTPCQRECVARLGMTIQLEQEAYLTQHPEIIAMLEIFIAQIVNSSKRREILKAAALHFTQAWPPLDEQIRKRLGVPMAGPYTKDNTPQFYYEDEELIIDLKKIITKHYPPEPWKVPSPVLSTPNTMSSSFISIITSDTTLPTPEPVKTPPPTLSEVMFAVVSNTVDKAIYSRVDDLALRYDTAYVEVMKAVEEAMEIPVQVIKSDIADLFFGAYKMFELLILEKERIAAEIAWEKRMRKKLKRTLRRQKNFKGYETPPTPKSEVSSHESYKKPPPRPCKCHPQFGYNRFPKDRFGIYLPREEQFDNESVTVTPAMAEEEPEDEPAGAAAAGAAASVKSAASSVTRSSKKVADK